jgi:hypothetical protein
MGTGFSSARYALEDVEVGNTVIPAGSTVFVSMGSANRDDLRFKHPDEFLVGRSNAHQHLTFGSGPAYCLGAALARVELQVAFGTVLHALPAIELAVPLDRIEWKSNLFSRIPSSLPVTWRDVVVTPSDEPRDPYGAQQVFSVAEALTQIVNRLGAQPETTQSLNAIFEFIVVGSGGGTWTLEVKEGSARLIDGVAVDADMTCRLSVQDFIAMASGDVSGADLTMSGRMHVTGNIRLGPALAALIRSARI